MSEQPIAFAAVDVIYEPHLVADEVRVFVPPRSKRKRIRKKCRRQAWRYVWRDAPPRFVRFNGMVYTNAAGMRLIRSRLDKVCTCPAQDGR